MHNWRPFSCVLMSGPSLRPEHLALKELVAGAFRDAVHASLAPASLGSGVDTRAAESVLAEAAAHAAAVLASAHRRCGPGSDVEGVSGLPGAQAATQQDAAAIHAPPPSGNMPEHALCKHPAAAAPSTHSTSKSSGGGPSSAPSTAADERGRMEMMEEDAVAAALAASAKPTGVRPRGLILPGLVLLLLGVLLVGLVLPVYLGAERSREQESGQVRGTAQCRGWLRSLPLASGSRSRCVAQRCRPTAAHASTCMHAADPAPACAALHAVRSDTAWRTCADACSPCLALALAHQDSCMHAWLHAFIHVRACLPGGRRITIARCTTRRRRCSQHRKRCRLPLRMASHRQQLTRRWSHST